MAGREGQRATERKWAKQAGQAMLTMDGWGSAGKAARQEPQKAKQDALPRHRQVKGEHTGSGDSRAVSRCTHHLLHGGHFRLHALLSLLQRLGGLLHRRLQKPEAGSKVGTAVMTCSESTKPGAAQIATVGCSL